MFESEEWWGWSHNGGGIWAAVLVIVMVFGTVLNLAIIIHWLMQKHLTDSPVMALPFSDFLLCIIAAPLRYSHAPPFTPINFQKTLSKNWTILQTSPDDGLDTSISVNVYVPSHVTAITDEGVIHIVVVSFCLLSLHIICLIALHRVCLLLVPCIPNLLSSTQFTSCIHWLILGLALIWTLFIIIGVSIIGDFTVNLPIMGVIGTETKMFEDTSLSVSFMIYLLSLVLITCISYIIILIVLIIKSQIRSLKPNDLSNLTPSDKFSQHLGRRRRVICMIFIVLITLSICWGIPLSLALHTVIEKDTELTRIVPYSDALLLLSGFVHPFVYTEGWGTVMVCCSAIKSFLFSKTYKCKRCSDDCKDKDCHNQNDLPQETIPLPVSKPDIEVNSESDIGTAV